MKIGRYNIQLQIPYGNTIKKYNVYINDSGTRFIYFGGKYIPIVKYSPYKSGWLWKFKEGELK